MPRGASWSGVPSIKGSSETTRMALLTFSLVGLQFTWGIEMTYCTPYLLQLGLSKSHTSAVWIAGPLSGLVMQPLVGVIADNSRSKWGRRRPFMVGGSFVVAACLLALGWTKEIVARFVMDEEKRASWTIVLAIASIYATDFSINAVQSCCRSLIVDTLPIPKQQLGSAWAVRMSAIGHLIGYAIGTLNLRALWGDRLGDTQFKQLCAIAGIALIIACAVTSYAVNERVLLNSIEEDNKKGAWKGAWDVLARIFQMTLNLPQRIQAICWIQFWAWIGWFPFLFYSPTWVGETYFRYSAPVPPSTTPTPQTDKLGEIGRIGSLSLLVFSIITFIASIILPFFIQSPTSSTSSKTSTETLLRPPRHESSPPPSSAASSSRRSPLFSPTFRPLQLLLLKPVKLLLRPIRPLLAYAPKEKPTLLTAWLYSHFVFAFAMLLAPFARSVGAATLLVAISGLPWALAGWAPFAFMGVEINRLAISGGSGSGPTSGGSSGGMAANGYPVRGRVGSLEGIENAEGGVGEVGVPLLRLHHNSRGSIDSDAGSDFNGPCPSPASTGETAGIYLGILNLFTTLPQFVGTFISMLVFAIFEPPAPSHKKVLLDDAGTDTATATGGKSDGDNAGGVNAIAVCLFIGGLCSLGAAYATRRFQALR